MFFYLGNECNLLDKQSEGLHTDLGWKNINDVYYKGYCLDYDIHSNIDKILEGDKPQGIYCLIQNNKLFYPEIRPFPLYQQGEVLTNLRLENFDEVAKDSYKLPTMSKTLNMVVKEVIDILVENLSKVELNIWCTGGIDSTMLIALAEYAKLPYTLYVAKPRNSFINVRDFEGTVEEYTSPLLGFCRKSYWAYELLSVFNDKVLTTGFYGDEYFCRTIWQIHALANSVSKTGSEIVSATDYVHAHINSYKYRNLNVLDTSIGLHNVKEVTLSSVGAGQVWHFDNTLTFCPLMDKRIIESVWSLDSKTLLECAPDATIQKEVILNTRPGVLCLIDKFKNSLDGRKNFFDNIKKVNLPHCIDTIVH